MNLVSQKYRILGKKGEGTFSEVLKCQNVKDGSYWACKKMKQLYESNDQVNNLREIQAMRRLSPHTNILELQEVIFDKKSGVLVLVCELMDMNIYELIRGRRAYLPEPKVKHFMYQLCKSLDHMHRNGIFHRDVKPENILVTQDLLKLADFGSCRSIYSKQPYTEYISTRWYRAPECLLTDGFYTFKMDLWSVGCVFYEVLSLHPLFPGSNEVDQIAKIHDIMGTPESGVLDKLKNKTRGMNFNFPPKKGTGLERLLPQASKEAVDLIYQLCTYDPDERITARQALKHPYFRDLRMDEKRAAAVKKAQEQRQQQQQQQQQPEKNDSSKENERPQSRRYPATKPQQLGDRSADNDKMNGVNLRRNSEESKDKSSAETRTDEKIGMNSQFLNPVLPKPLNALDRRRRRRKHIVAPLFSHGSIYPRVSQPLNVQYHHSSAFGTTTFPRIHGNSIMPTLGAFRTKPKAMTQPPSKVTYAHYHLPSIIKRDPAGF